MNVDVNTHWSSELYIVPKGLGQIYKYLVGIEDIFTLIARISTYLKIETEIMNIIAASPKDEMRY
jgi:hypothetical protein